MYVYVLAINFKVIKEIYVIKLIMNNNDNKKTIQSNFNNYQKIKNVVIL